MKNNQPKIRLGNCTGDWEKRKIGELADIYRGASPRPIQDPKWFDDKSEVGWLRISDVTEQNGRIYYLSQHISELGQEKTRVLKGSHLLLSIAATVGKPVINYVSTGVHDGFLIFSKPKFDREFMFQWLDMFRPKWQKYGQPGSQINLNSSLVKNQEINIPTYIEQQKIGEFFKQLDDRIALQQRHVEQLKQSKQGFLQKMFPKDGESVPEVRFEGFSGEWKKRKMKSILIERNEQITENSEYPLMSFVQGKGVTPKSERYDRGFLVKNSDKKYKKTEYGDFIYSSNNLETGSIGFNRTGKAVISPVYSIFYSNNNIESQFIGILSMQRLFVNKMIRFRQGVVYGQWRIHEKDFLNISMRIPDLQEQQVIIDFFNKLDDLIAKNERELELLQETKKGFLQKMFV